MIRSEMSEEEFGLRSKSSGGYSVRVARTSTAGDNFFDPEVTTSLPGLSPEQSDTSRLPKGR
jgi:hypothetical protein